MNLKSTLLALGLFISMSVFATDYYIRSEANGTGNGLSWDNAMSFKTFYENFQKNANYADGDVFYFAEGRYVVPAVSAVAQIAKGFTFKGGYPKNLTGTELPKVDYSVHRTIISGDRNGDGVQNAGDARCLFALQANTTSTTTPQKPILIQGIDFCYVYTAEPTSSDGYRKGALCIDNCGDVTIKDCRFHHNELAAEGDRIGGAALLSYRSTVHLIDCEFTSNKTKSNGAAIRVASNAVNKGVLTVERCLFMDNETNKNGSAICVQESPKVNIINSAIVNNTGTEAIYIASENDGYARVLNIVNSTIVSNTGGNQIKMVNGKIANSIIVGCAGETEAKAIEVTGSTADITSGGYNLLCANPITIAGSDCVFEGDAYTSLFGDKKITYEDFSPVKAPNGATEDELNAAVSGWGLEGIDLTVDVNGNERKLTVPGAVKADALPTTIKVSDAKVATYYNNVYGYTMPEGLTGYTITGTSGNKIVVNAKYQAGANVPKGAALLIAGEPNEYAFAFKLAETDNKDNLLKGTQENKDVTAETGKCIYKLANDTERGLGFYWGSLDGKTLNNKANKCYLELDETTASAKPYFIIGTITGISNVDTDKPTDDGFYYTLSGIRVANPRGGIYIKNGKKVIIK